MQELFGFLGLVIIISASGVMSPGPLFAANVMYGLREGKISGLKMAIGHTIVEFPLILFLGIGFFSIENMPEIRIVITILGATGLFGFATLQIRSVIKKEFSIESLLIVNFLAYCDGDNDLIWISEKIKCPIWKLFPIINRLLEENIITRINKIKNSI